MASVLMTSLSVYFTQENKSSLVPGQSEIKSNAWPARSSSMILFAPSRGPGQDSPLRSRDALGLMTVAVFTLVTSLAQRLRQAGDLRSGGPQREQVVEGLAVCTRASRLHARQHSAEWAC